VAMTGKAHRVVRDRKEYGIGKARPQPSRPGYVNSVSSAMQIAALGHGNIKG
jgi:hypothetical protein